jgi:hypothetical protein
VNREIADRLVCAKYIFQRGSEQVDKGGVYSDGLAVLHFQDAAEMVLRIFAEHLHCSIKESIAFNQLIEEIDKAGKGTLTHRTALNQLNKSRTNFKHFGLQPKHEDVVKFQRDLDGFFSTSLYTFLDLDFDSLSLINLVAHCRVKIYLKKSEELFNSDDYQGAVGASATAFFLYQKYAGSIADGVKISGVNDDNGSNRSLISGIEGSLNSIQDQINTIMLGINLGDYRRFTRYVPQVQVTYGGRIFVNWLRFGRPAEISRETAAFCFRFALDSILLMQQYRVDTHFIFPFVQIRFQVLRETEVMVVTHESKDILRIACEGEILLGYYEHFDQIEYFAVNQDDDCAFVNRNDVQLLSNEV